MDAIFPFLTRGNTTQQTDSPRRLILPVNKYERIHTEAEYLKKVRVGWQDPKQKQQQQNQQDAQAQPHEFKTIEEELHLIPTSHAVTPESEQHADAEGHLDIYI